MPNTHPRNNNGQQTFYFFFLTHPVMQLKHILHFYMYLFDTTHLLSQHFSIILILTSKTTLFFVRLCNYTSF